MTYALIEQKEKDSKQYQGMVQNIKKKKKQLGKNE